eukprot:TRINITY_DN77725_c0_g1_i1.p1 TRINITY_DN77725_c0_g1~~TRINITY_DN77725_c0_g1_i1.p1  ORF type:complete len:1764 (-),score=486.63 TRINITY_DN77725_c0_g1_i1:84-5375(-)
MESTWYKGFRLKKKEANQRHESSATSLPGTPGACKSQSGDRTMLAKTHSAPQLRKPGNLSASEIEFLDRQANSFTVVRNKKLAKISMQVTKSLRLEDDVEFYGAQGIPGLRKYLRKNFGSIVAGWRALDSDNNGRLTFYEFCNACRRMGYHGNLKQIWNDLDKNLDGVISLVELDPEAGKTVGQFKLALMNEYGDMATAWKKGLDTNGSGRIDEPEIEAAVKKLGLKLNPQRLYCMLRSAPGKNAKGLTLKELDPDAFQRLEIGDHKGLMSRKDDEFLQDLGDDVEMPKDVQEHPLLGMKGAARKWRAQLKAEDFAQLQKALGDIAEFSLGLHTPDGFRRALIGRCGSLLSAWRKALDLDGNGRLMPGEFCLALRRLGFHGDITGIFRGLDEDKKGYLVFADLDKETDSALTELRSKMIEKHGNMLLAWVKGLDRRGTGCVSKADFQRACSDVGFEGNASKLWRKLKPEPGRNFLALRDFDTKAYLALSRGDFRMLSEPDEKAKTSGEDEEGGLLSMSFEERQSCGFFHKIRRAWDASKRAEFAKACQLANTPERLIDTLEEFEQLCIRKYGTIIQAWRQCLDRDHNGRLTFNEFCEALRRLGYAGDLKALWEEYGGRDLGCLTLKDLDPEADELVNSFLDLLKERYGHVDIAWTKGFGKDPHDSIDEGELVKACEVMGYPHSAKKLFKCLVPDKGKVLLTIWDIDPVCSRERARGGGAAAGAVCKGGKSPTHHAGRTGHMFGAEDSAGGTSNKAREGEGPNVKAARTAMKNKHGSTAAAWRNVLGVQTLQTDYTNFCRLMCDCDFQGSYKELWKEVAESGDGYCPSSSSKARGDRAGGDEAGGNSTFKGKACTTFGIIDPQAQAILRNTRQKLISRFETLRRAWSEFLAIAQAQKAEECARNNNTGGGAEPSDKGVNRVTLKAFSGLCEQNGIKSPERAFRLLLLRPGQLSLHFKDLEVLLLGVPPDEHEELLGKAAPPKPEKSKREELDELIHDEEKSNCGEVRTVKAFKQLLVKRHGSIFAAWRGVLDVDHNGVVTQAEFSKACNDLGVRHVRELWSELDRVKNGQIGLADIDPEVDQLFRELEQLLIDKYGSTVNGWRQCFQLPPPKCKQVDEDKFTRQCAALGMTGDGAKLFKLLRPENGRQKHLVFEDLWRSLNKNATTREKKGGKNAATPAAPKKQQTDRTEESTNVTQDDVTVLIDDLVTEEPAVTEELAVTEEPAATIHDQPQEEDLKGQEERPVEEADTAVAGATQEAPREEAAPDPAESGQQLAEETLQEVAGQETTGEVEKQEAGQDLQRQHSDGFEADEFEEEPKKGADGYDDDFDDFENSKEFSATGDVAADNAVGEFEEDEEEADAEGKRAPGKAEAERGMEAGSPDTFASENPGSSKPLAEEAMQAVAPPMEGAGSSKPVAEADAEADHKEPFPAENEHTADAGFTEATSADGGDVNADVGTNAASTKIQDRSEDPRYSEPFADEPERADGIAEKEAALPTEDAGYTEPFLDDEAEAPAENHESLPAETHEHPEEHGSAEPFANEEEADRETGGKVSSEGLQYKASSPTNNPEQTEDPGYTEAFYTEAFEDDDGEADEEAGHETPLPTEETLPVNAADTENLPPIQSQDTAGPGYTETFADEDEEAEPEYSEPAYSEPFGDDEEKTAVAQHQAEAEAQPGTYDDDGEFEEYDEDEFDAENEDEDVEVEYEDDGDFEAEDDEGEGGGGEGEGFATPSLGSHHQSLHEETKSEGDFEEYMPEDDEEEES